MSAKIAIANGTVVIESAKIQALYDRIAQLERQLVTTDAALMGEEGELFRETANRLGVVLGGANVTELNIMGQVDGSVGWEARLVGDGYPPQELNEAFRRTPTAAFNWQDERGLPDFGPSVRDQIAALDASARRKRRIGTGGRRRRTK